MGSTVSSIVDSMVDSAVDSIVPRRPSELVPNAPQRQAAELQYVLRVDFTASSTVDIVSIRLYSRLRW